MIGILANLQIYMKPLIIFFSQSDVGITFENSLCKVIAWGMPDLHLLQMGLWESIPIECTVKSICRRLCLTYYIIQATYIERYRYC